MYLFPSKAGLEQYTQSYLHGLLYYKWFSRKMLFNVFLPLSSSSLYIVENVKIGECAA